MLYETGLAKAEAEEKRRGEERRGGEGRGGEGRGEQSRAEETVQYNTLGLNRREQSGTKQNNRGGGRVE